MTIRHVGETGSTNADMREWAALPSPESAREGDWILADRQTAGRGRQGRAWQSLDGNLFASTLVRLRREDLPAQGLALVTGVALFDTAAHWIAPARLQLKWPNDLNGDGAKLAGVLLERTGDAVVIGVGVNLARGPMLPDRATTSLHALAGSTLGPAEFLDWLAQCLRTALRAWREDGEPALHQQWLSRAHPIGTPLSAHLPDGARISGRFGGLAPDGALRLTCADGRQQLIHAGDVYDANRHTGSADPSSPSGSPVVSGHLASPL